MVGGYADRLVVELAQNAADAAARDGVPGRLRLRLEAGPTGLVLTAANTGAPLDTAGVDGLTSLRASGKRDTPGRGTGASTSGGRASGGRAPVGRAPGEGGPGDEVGEAAGGAPVGRFGVGFAAVLGVSDAPEVRSRGGGVVFSAARTAAEVTALGGAVAAEAARRGAGAARVPVLRLVWPAAEPPAPPYDTEVVLPLRAGAEDRVRQALADVDAALLLALPELGELDVDGRVVRRAGKSDGLVVLDDAGTLVRWRRAARSGVLPPALLAARPVEERERTAWSVLAAVPVDEAGTVLPLPRPQVVHAPTPSDEPLSLPVRLVGTFPLDPSRRRVPPGPVTDLLAAEAGAAVADLVTAGAAGTSAPPPGAARRVLALLPRPALAGAPFDAAVCRAVLTGLAARPWLPTQQAGTSLPGRALVVDDALVAPLADVLDGLLPVGWWTRDTAAVLAALGVRRLSLADVVEAVSGLGREPDWWRALYAGLAGLPPDARADADSLAALPVPLVDGRTVTGPRGLLLPGDGLPADAAQALGLRVVSPAAVHPLLERLGAVPATPRTVLADDRVQAAVLTSLDSDDPEPLAEAVLALVSAADLEPGEEPGLADLALPTADGGWAPAGELLLPGGPLASVVRPGTPFGTLDASFLGRHGAGPLTAVGVLTTFAVLDAGPVDLDDLDEHHLDDAEAWSDAVLDALDDPPGPVRLARLRAVRDLEEVRADAWAAALALLARDPLRAVLAEPARVVLPDGSGVDVPGYTRWWVTRHARLHGRPPGAWRTAGATDLTGLYDALERPAGSALDDAVLGLVGCRTGLADVLADAAGDAMVAGDLLDRLGDPARTVRPDVLGQVYARLAAALRDRAADLPPPARVRVAPDRVVPAEQVVVLDAPWLLDRLGDLVPVAGGADPAAVAHLLDVPLLSEL